MKQQRFSNLTVLNCHKKLTESLDVIQIANTFAGRNENCMKNFGIFTNADLLKSNKYWIKSAKSCDRNKSNTMILSLFSIFNMKKIFSIVSLPIFHLAPRSLNVVPFLFINYRIYMALDETMKTILIYV